MPIKKLADFLREKQESRCKIRCCCQNYRENILANFSSLILKNQDATDMVKNILDVNKIKKNLESISYPYIEAFCIAAKSGSINSLEKNMTRCRLWTKSHGINSANLAVVEELIQNFEAKHLGESFGPIDVDIVVNSLVTECNILFNKVVAKLEMITEQLELSNSIELEAIMPEDGLLVDSMLVKINGIYPALFTLNHTHQGFKAENFVSNNLPDRVRTQYQSLMKKLQENPNYKQIISLYMPQPTAKRRLFEQKKKEIALGYKTVLPEGTTLTNMIIDENIDYWRVKLPKEYLISSLHEGDMLSYHLVEDAPVRWLELVKKGQDEK